MRDSIKQYFADKIIDLIIERPGITEEELCACVSHLPNVVSNCLEQLESEQLIKEQKVHGITRFYEYGFSGDAMTFEIRMNTIQKYDEQRNKLDTVEEVETFIKILDSTKQWRKETAQKSSEKTILNLKP